LSFFIGEMTKS